MFRTGYLVLWWYVMLDRWWQCHWTVYSDELKGLDINQDNKKGAIHKVKFTVTWLSGSAFHGQRKWREDRNEKVSKLQTGLQNWSWNLNRVLLDEQAFINLRLKHFCTRYFGLHLQERTVCFKDYCYFAFHEFLFWAVRMETDPPTCRHIQNSSIKRLELRNTLENCNKGCHENTLLGLQYCTYFASKRVKNVYISS